MNIDHTKEEIYEWLEQLSFAELSEEQKKVVLAEIDQETYNEMHEAILMLSSKHIKTSAKRKEASKKVILADFNRRTNKSPLVLLLQKPISLGKAAAIILLLCSALLWLGLSKTTTPLVENTTLSKDTVYLTQEKVVTEKVYDTVYEKSVVYVQPRSTANPIITRPKTKNNLQDINLNIVSTDDRNSLKNKSKKNNFKHDTLVKKVGFVSM